MKRAGKDGLGKESQTPLPPNPPSFGKRRSCSFALVCQVRPSES